MKNGIAEIKEVKEINALLLPENKKYVIAVANALLFSQGDLNKSTIPKEKLHKKAAYVGGGKEVQNGHTY